MAASAILEQKGKTYEALDFVQSIYSNSMIPEFREILTTEEKRLVNLIANSTPAKNPLKLKMNDRDKIPTKVSLISSIGESNYKRSSKDSKIKNKNLAENSENVNNIVNEIQVSNEEKNPIENMQSKDENENNKKEKNLDYDAAAFVELTDKKINSPEIIINGKPESKEINTRLNGKNSDIKQQNLNNENPIKNNHLKGKENTKFGQLNQEDTNQKKEVVEENSIENDNQKKIPTIDSKSNH